MFVKRMIIDQSSLVEHSWIHIDATEGDTVVKKVDKVIDWKRWGTLVNNGLLFLIEHWSVDLPRIMTIL